MGGIEPPSEKQNLQLTTLIVCLLMVRFVAARQTGRAMKLVRRSVSALASNARGAYPVIGVVLPFGQQAGLRGT